MRRYMPDTADRGGRHGRHPADCVAAVRRQATARPAAGAARSAKATAAAQRDPEGSAADGLSRTSCARCCRANAIVTDELSQVGFASWYGFPIYKPRTFITSGYQGTLGSGFPTALGAKVANPDRPVVAITGDGGFMFGVQELSTAVQFKIGVVTLVFNNSAYGNARRDQQDRFDGRVVAADLVNPDFVKLAESFGVGAARVTSPGSLPARAGKGAGRRRSLRDLGRGADGFGSHAVDVHPSGEEYLIFFSQLKLAAPIAIVLLPATSGRRKITAPCEKSG